MKCLILAAGLGSRMKPFTDTTPKPLLPILETPLIQIAIEKIQKAGIEEIFVNTYHLKGRLSNYLKKKYGSAIQIIEEDHLLGTGGAVGNIKHLLGQADLLVYNSDVITNIDLASLIENYRSQNQSFVTMALMGSWVETTNPVLLDGDRVASIGKSSDAPGIPTTFTGIHIIPAEVHQSLPSTEHSIIDPYREILLQGKVIQGWIHNGYWKDLGTPNHYWRCYQDILGMSAQQQKDIGLVVEAEVGRGIVRGSGSSIHPNATLEGQVFCLQNSVIEADSFVKNSIVYNSVVKTNQRISNSIVINQQVLSHE